MNQAHTAKEQFKANSQEHDFKDLEKKILEILDRRLQSSDVQSADKCVRDFIPFITLYYRTYELCSVLCRFF